MWRIFCESRPGVILADTIHQYPDRYAVGIAAAYNRWMSSQLPSSPFPDAVAGFAWTSILNSNQPLRLRCDGFFINPHHPSFRLLTSELLFCMSTTHSPHAASKDTYSPYLNRLPFRSTYPPQSTLHALNSSAVSPDSLLALF